MSGARKGGLGRGLGALIPSGPPGRADETGLSPGDLHSGQSGNDRGRRDLSSGNSASDVSESDEHVGDRGSGAAVYRELPADSIRPNTRQPRTVFDDDALDELVRSITEVGVLQPIVVRETSPGGYELVMGERRWRAAQLAGLDRIPAIVRFTADDAMLRDALLENLHRQQLNPLEEAAAYQQLLEEFGATHDELAGRIGRSRPQISNTIRLLQLTPPVQRRVAAGILSAGHARALLGLQDPSAQEQLAARIVAEGLSVRAVEELVAVDEPRRRRPARAARVGSADLSDVAEQVSDRLQTRVKVAMGRSRGTMTIEFADAADLQRIATVISGGPAT